MTDASLTRAIVRTPAATFARGLTTVDLGAPILETALRQHEAYCEALRGCGLEVTRLAADPRFPDSTFVEDAAVVTPEGAILTRPGAPSREGEVAAVEEALAPHYAAFRRITPPGTVDGGDVCEAGLHFFIGISRRTNTTGARQLAGYLAQDGYTSSFVDIRGLDAILHLKSGLAWLGDNRLAVIEPLLDPEMYHGYDVVPVEAGESYAANCVRINDRLLVAEGFPKLARALDDLHYNVVTVPMSEYRKMDGGLSCLSLRF